ncbi:hypothetical protein HY346_02080 [Candidatus Microgenomates bacterium]|nr:hypothetical protein [Candidatus Microgenomates bacterium]
MPKPSKLSAELWVFQLIQAVLAYEWLKSAWGKFMAPDFMNGIDKTLSTFASKTPQRWYGDFLGSADATVFGNVTRFSELLVGLGLVFGTVYIWKRLTGPRIFKLVLPVALLGGALLNLNFYWAAGWSSPSTAGINLVMGSVQAILGGYYLWRFKKAA